MTRVSRGLMTVALAASLMMGTAMAAPSADSRVSALNVGDIQPVGTFNGVAYVRTYGVVTGMIGQGEDVVGFAELPKNAPGSVRCKSEFEIIAPAPGQPANEVIFIDAENRGGAVMLNLVNEAGVQGSPSRARYADGLGNGFLQRHATSYAKEKYLEQLYGESLTKLIAQGFVPPEDEIAMLGYASYLWDNTDNYIARSRAASSQ